VVFITRPQLNPSTILKELLLLFLGAAVSKESLRILQAREETEDRS